LPFQKKSLDHLFKQLPGRHPGSIVCYCFSPGGNYYTNTGREDAVGGNMSVVPSLNYDPQLEPLPVRAAVVWGLGLPNCAATVAAPAYLSEILARVCAAGESFLSAERKAAVRNMLRFGAYKPSGRSKPSSEYLLAAALEGNFPLVNGPVDANNAVSLESGYPASIFDTDLCGSSLILRRGMPGESYVFNPSGQIIDLKDLLCVCRAEGESWLPCGNPVKDAMSTKTRETTRNVAAVIYAPVLEPRAALDAAAERFARLLGTECGAAETGWSVI
jgi:DNA/RNA-binding domain of Phe-tRNA-synthetase-like protein